MTDLALPVCSITSTKRRRYFWAVWSHPPTHAPFKKPDASGGGAASRDEALAEAEAKIGSSVRVIDPLWARAWIRVLRGEPAWPSKASRGSREGAETATSPVPDRIGESVWTILGVTRDVTPEELKAAYRKRALETHPDRGGSDERFRQVVRAYAEAERRVRRPRPRAKG